MGSLVERQTKKENPIFGGSPYLHTYPYPFFCRRELKGAATDPSPPLAAMRTLRVQAPVSQTKPPTTVGCLAPKHSRFCALKVTRHSFTGVPKERWTLTETSCTPGSGQCTPQCIRTEHEGLQVCHILPLTTLESLALASVGSFQTSKQLLYFAKPAYTTPTHAEQACTILQIMTSSNICLVPFNQGRLTCL